VNNKNPKKNLKDENNLARSKSPKPVEEKEKDTSKDKLMMEQD